MIETKGVTARNPDDWLRRIETAGGAVDRAEASLAAARASYRKAIRDANEAGVSLAAIGRALGVSRQRVKRIIDGA